MKIQVEDKVFIESDSTQFILKKYTGKTDKHGDEVYKVLGYFSTLKGALNKILKLKIMNSQATTIKELLKDFERIEKEMDELIKV